MPFPPSIRSQSDDTHCSVDPGKECAPSLPSGITHPVRAKCIVELNKSSPDHPQSNPISARGHLLCVKRSTLPKAGLGLFAINDIKEGTPLLRGGTPAERLSEFGKHLVFDGRPFFCSSPRPITSNFWSNYQYEIVDEESQAVLNKVWAATQKSWAKDLELLFEHDLLPPGATDLELPSEECHPYILSVDRALCVTDDDRGYVREKYYDTFETIWGFMNSPKHEGDDNITFAFGQYDGDEPTQIVASRDIGAGEELLWFYGDDYWRLGTFDNA